jgi:hypothetical protein
VSCFFLRRQRRCSSSTSGSSSSRAPGAYAPADAVRPLVDAARHDPARALQQSFCYKHRPGSYTWSVTVAWGYISDLVAPLPPRLAFGRPVGSVEPSSSAAAPTRRAVAAIDASGPGPVRRHARSARRQPQAPPTPPPPLPCDPLNCPSPQPRDPRCRPGRRSCSGRDRRADAMSPFRLREPGHREPWPLPPRAPLSASPANASRALASASPGRHGWIESRRYGTEGRERDCLDGSGPGCGAGDVRKRKRKERKGKKE